MAVLSCAKMYVRMVNHVTEYAKPSFVQRGSPLIYNLFKSHLTYNQYHINRRENVFIYFQKSNYIGKHDYSVQLIIYNY